MMGFVTRGLVLAFGYAYPAYECYKTVEMNKPNIEQLRFWCQYWILVAGLTVCDRIADMFIGWIPMYGEAKLAFFIYLWLPKTKGTTFVYNSFFRPYVAKHEPEIDRNLLELKTRAGDIALMYIQKAASYGQTRFFDILNYIATQSSRPRAAQTQPQGLTVQKPVAPSTSVPTTQPQDGHPPSPASSNEDADYAPVASNVHLASHVPCEKSQHHRKEVLLEDAADATQARSRKPHAASDHH